MSIDPTYGCECPNGRHERDCAGWDGRLDLYHRTSREAARAIIDSGRFVTRENTREAYASTHVAGQGVGYGDVVVHVRVSESDAQLDDEFPDGEEHYRFPLDQAEVVEAFIVGPDGEQVPLPLTEGD